MSQLKTEGDGTNEAPFTPAAPTHANIDDILCVLMRLAARKCLNDDMSAYVKVVFPKDILHFRPTIFKVCVKNELAAREVCDMDWSHLTDLAVGDIYKHPDYQIKVHRIH